MAGSEPVILVVDDDPGIQSLLGRYLREQGFAVLSATDGAGMDRIIQSGERIDLIVLDIMLPGENGLSIARRLDHGNRPPIIMLSARGEDIDRIVGLEVGADDYLAKPFNPRELIARIHAVLRRSPDGEPGEEPGNTSDGNQLQRGDFRLDLDTHQAYLNDAPLSLTHGEWTLLKLFLDHANRVLNRDQIMDSLKGYERGAFDRSIDVRVTRLRRKIEPDPSKPRYLVTIWGEGYLFAPAGRAPQVGESPSASAGSAE